MSDSAPQRFVLFLRGVNVGGVTVKSAELTAVLSDIGLGRPRTVLASGNAIVDAADVDTAKERAASALAMRYGRSVPVVSVPLAQLQRVVDAYPFPLSDATTPYVVFELEPGVAAKLTEIGTINEPVSLGDGVLYWANPKGTTTTTPVATTIEKLAKGATTTRNLRTLRRILAVEQPGS